MRGNRDGGSMVRHTFRSQKLARYIRVYPMAYRYRICMRMELYGCPNCKLLICVFSFSFLIKIRKNKWSGKLPVLCACLINDISEMYPECVIASWDTLVLLLDAENIEQRVLLDAEKKIECLCKLQTPGKNSGTRYATLCFVKTNVLPTSFLSTD